jgi:hypothetical protein
MSQQAQPKEYNNREDLKKIIEDIDETNDLTLEPQMTYALGHYFSLLQKECGVYRVFKDEYLPISKERHKLWSFEYLKQKFLKNRKLLKYEEDGALLFTAYQPMTNSEWELFISQTVSDINYFQIDLIDNKKSDIILPQNIKNIMERQNQEYILEKEEFRNLLVKLPKSKASLTTILIILTILFVFIYFLINGI